MLALLTGCAAPIPGDPAQPGEQAGAATPLPWHHEFDPPVVDSGLRGRISSIVDGDTVQVMVQSQTMTVRLLGIDTPEKLGGPRPAECFGSEATEFAHQLMPIGTEVLLTRDQQTRDQYGRLLAWIHRDDGVFVNLAMVESGHASALFFPPNDDLEPLFEQAAWAARRLDRGFWPVCGASDVVLPPPTPGG